ncbi:hypothetical protein, partial [Acinetobacter lactucae]
NKYKADKGYKKTDNCHINNYLLNYFKISMLNTSHFTLESHEYVIL